MKLYLSSYRLGNHASILKELLEPSGGKVALIPNAGDYRADDNVTAEKIRSYCELFKDIGIETIVSDLRQYFGKQDKFVRDFESFRAFFATGGNVFVLRQAMHLSGFDQFLLSLKDRDDYLYGGWSAGMCVLAKNLKGIELCDSPSANPYDYETMWDGIGLLDYLPVPHYESEPHPEAHLMYDVVAYLEKNKLPYKTLRDGDVIIKDTVTGKERDL